MYPETIETDSLVLRRLSPANVGVFELYERFAEGREGARGVFEYVPQEAYSSPKEARDRLDGAASTWEDGDAAQYAAYASDGGLAGYAGLFPQWERRTGILGCVLARPYWGRGHAGECAISLTELAFDRLDLELVVIGHEAGNERSKRAIEKYVDLVGGRYDGMLRKWTPLDDAVVDHHRYTVTREAFRRATGDG